MTQYTDKFMSCLAFVDSKAIEGGKSNHPKDAGGRTNRGVTQASYDAYRRSQSLNTRDVYEITGDEVIDLYWRNYWEPIRGDELPIGLDVAVFDFAVNSGVSRAVRYLQSVLGVSPDGWFGNSTLAAVKDAVKNRQVREIAHALIEKRLAFMKQAKNRKTGEALWPTFGKGWTRRINLLTARVDRDLENAAKSPIPLPKPTDPEPAKKARDWNWWSALFGAGGLATYLWTTLEHLADLLEGRFSAPVVGVILMVIMLVLIVLAVRKNGEAVRLLSPGQGERDVALAESD